MQQKADKMAEKRRKTGALKRGHANLDGSGTSKSKPWKKRILNYWMKSTTIELLALNAEATDAEQCSSDQ